MGRPRGTFGEISRAILDAASAGPATVRELAQRGQVGMRAAKYTCSRLLQAGELVALHPGRPAVLTRSLDPVPIARRERAKCDESMDAICALLWPGR